jgi:UV DNA damage endonuclease
MHPGQYTVLNALNPKVIEDSVRELEWQARLISELDPWQGLIVLHVGGAYGDKAQSIQRFADNFRQFTSPVVQERLTLENDDTTYPADEVLQLCRQLNLPMIFDLFHHKCLHTAAHWEEGLPGILEQVVATWKGRIPKVHLSSQKPGTRTTHADYITDDDFEELLHWMATIHPGGEFDLMIEAKMKDKAVLELQNWEHRRVQAGSAGR